MMEHQEEEEKLTQQAALIDELRRGRGKIKETGELSGQRGGRNETFDGG